MAFGLMGEIRMFGGTWAPRGWDLCHGQTLPISENEVLFEVIGITYGGDGQETFKLPDLQGRVPVHKGEGEGITQKYPLGSQGGEEDIMLSEAQIPVHQHGFMASEGPGAIPNAEGHILGSPPAVTLFRTRVTPDSKLPPQAVVPVGENQAHENRMPYLTISYIINVDGYPPPRN